MKRLLLIFALLLSSSPSWAAWARTNAKTGTGGGAGGTAVPAAAFTAALTNPSLIVVWCDTANTAFTINVPTDTATNTYVGIDSAKTNATSVKGQWFYALNTSNQASNIVTCNFGGTLGTQTNVIAAEYTGGATSSPVDVSSMTIGTVSLGVPQPTAQLTTTGSSDLVIAAARSAASETFAAGAGFTLIAAATARDSSEQTTALGSAPGTYNPNFTGVGNGSLWVEGAVAFCPSGGCGGSSATSTVGKNKKLTLLGEM